MRYLLLHWFLGYRSGDSTARIWDLSTPTSLERPPLVLHHVVNPGNKAKDVTTLDWHPEGKMLATGSYDGLARIWSVDGECHGGWGQVAVWVGGWGGGGTCMYSGRPGAR